VYSAGADTWAGRKADGTDAGTEVEGINAEPSVRAVCPCACACMAAARVAGMARVRDSAAAGWAIASDDRTTAGRAAVVAAIIGRLDRVVGFGERDVVMGKVLFSAANAAGLAGNTGVTSVTQVIAVTNVIHVNLS
jgi:hypothetical protein